MTVLDAEPPIPPECATTLALLHRRLDGESVETSAEVAAHAALCPDCRARLVAARLLAAAPAPHEPPVPALVTERIITGVLADARRRRSRRWSLSTIGIAAAVTFALWLTRPTTPVTPIPSVPEVVREQPPPNLREGFVEAGEAVASLTRRTAAEAVGPVEWGLPTDGPEWWSMPTLQAPSRPFEDAGVALADGFEPVTTSARRAARLFWRELAQDD
jgi:hypothetical protein